MLRNIFENTLKRLMYFFGKMIFPHFHLHIQYNTKMHIKQHAHIHTSVHAFMPPLMYHKAPFLMRILHVLGLIAIDLLQIIRYTQIHTYIHIYAFTSVISW